MLPKERGARVLVTGGAGMIGSNLVKRLVGTGYDVSVIDDLSRGRVEYLNDESGRPVIDLASRLYRCDMSIPGSFEHHFKHADYVFHLADVVAGIGFVFANQGHIFRQNLLINSNAINAARMYPPKGFIYAGTACSFPAHMQSGVDAAPLREEDQYPAAPESAYGWSKLMGEYEASLLEQERSVPVSIAVLHNVYGAPCDYASRTSQVIPSLIRKAVNHPEEEFIVWGSGKQGRAFVHVDDVVDGLECCLTRGLGQGVVQLGTDVCTSIAEIAELVARVSGKQIRIAFDTSKPEGDRGRRADYSKATRVLGWRPETSLEEGIRALYRWIEADMAARSPRRSHPAPAARGVETAGSA